MKSGIPYDYPYNPDFRGFCVLEIDSLPTTCKIGGDGFGDLMVDCDIPQKHIGKIWTDVEIIDYIRNHKEDFDPTMIGEFFGEDGIKQVFGGWD